MRGASEPASRAVRNAGYDEEQLEGIFNELPQLGMIQLFFSNNNSLRYQTGGYYFTASGLSRWSWRLPVLQPAAIAAVSPFRGRP
jgi:hypothetical protein